jgi:hypothetical protein
VTTVGVLLLYQDQTARYESWVVRLGADPGIGGAALAVHGLRFHRSDLVSVGTRMIAVFGVLLLVGAWFFETIFRTNQAPFDLGDNWPIVLIALAACCSSAVCCGAPLEEGPTSGLSRLLRTSSPGR